MACSVPQCATETYPIHGETSVLGLEELCGNETFFWSRASNDRLHLLAEDGHKKEETAMKKMVWLVGGMAASVVGFLVWNSRRIQPVEQLAHRLEEAWSDHHTTV